MTHYRGRKLMQNEELTDYSNEERQGILLFLRNDLEWYEAENNLNPIISSYLKKRMEDFLEEEN